jgi:hypothetical protein
MDAFLLDSGRYSSGRRRKTAGRAWLIGQETAECPFAGTPTISCGTEMISFWVKTRNPFKGKVYVKGEYGKAECTTNFANMTGEE